MKIIVTNATAADQSGALTILKQFVESIPENGFFYIVFTSPKVVVTTKKSNILFVPVPGAKSLVKRFLWDAYGLKKWLRKNHFVPSATISLQNTNYRCGFDVPRFIYYHQPIPFFKNRWSPLSKYERTFWFYKNIYPFFVRLFLTKDTEIFVQLNFIKDGFASFFRHSRDKIHVVYPTINYYNTELGKLPDLDPKKIHLFYPATPLFYKNHSVLIEALRNLDPSKFKLYLTCTHLEDCNCQGLDIEFMGSVPFETILDMYRRVDALLFPSYIETFGLPQIEAASLGLAVIASDLPYAREVLAGYEGATFVDYKDSEKWREAILKLEKNKRFSPLQKPQIDSWPKLFEVVENSIK